jgi:gliding motility-associated-like protein
MFRYYLIICCLFILLLDNQIIFGQADTVPPLSPVLDLVSVDPITEDVELSWSLSQSSDVIGYIIYLLKGNAGYAIDTINDPLAESYTWTGSGSSFYSESFVIAAFDSGNRSPLSNPLTTIFIEAELDTCNRKINLNWNSYVDYPKKVLGYTVFQSVDGGDYIKAGETDPGITNYTIKDFMTSHQYCFIISASLEGGYISQSNKACLNTVMKRTPDWINNDYVTVNDQDQIELSFTIDPASEIRILNIERKTGSSGNFEWIAQLPPAPDPQRYTDTRADIGKINIYRAYVKNSCGVPVKYSNTGSNIVLSALLSERGLVLSWNPYRKWAGDIITYRIYVDTGRGWENEAEPDPDDSTYLIKDIAGLMYRAVGNEICFQLKAYETMNPYGISGESQSARICIPLIEKITVPDVFTPDNNTQNDFFRPVLSFDPVEYNLVITDLKRRTVFETDEYSKEWDGSLGGKPLPEGVYLWFLRVRSPSGKSYSRTGTITIVFNR